MSYAGEPARKIFGSVFHHTDRLHLPSKNASNRSWLEERPTLWLAIDSIPTDPKRDPERGGLVSWAVVFHSATGEAKARGFLPGENHDATLTHNWICAMARTRRRRFSPHLQAKELASPFLHEPPIGARSKEGRRILARFFSDAGTRLGPHRAFRRAFLHRLDTHNDRQMHLFLIFNDFDPVFETRHLHSARRVWLWH